MRPAAGLATAGHRRCAAAAGRQRHRPSGDRRRGGATAAAGQAVSDGVYRTARRCVNDSACPSRPTGTRRCAREQTVPLSILDLSPISAGSDAATALRNTIDLAQRAEQWGYRRFWIAEHHFVGVASSAPAVLIGQIAAATNTIQVGSAAVQLGHTTAAAVVESFGMLDAFYPGRIDLGLGRGQRRDTGFKPKRPSAKNRPPRQWREVDGVVIPLPFDLRGLLDTERVHGDDGDSAAAGGCGARLRRSTRRHPRDARRQLRGRWIRRARGAGGAIRVGAVDLWQYPGAERAAGRRARSAVRGQLPHHPGDRAGSHRGLSGHVRPVGNAAGALCRGVRRRRGRRRQRHRKAIRGRLRAVGVLHPHRGGRGALPGSRRLPAADRRAAAGGQGPAGDAIRRRSRRGRRAAVRTATPERCRRTCRHIGDP